ncbi:MAG: hypothetical protein PHT07_10625 [Paludibacter sp.]|nr:hypothetical protein [Paludibacter sp.]
MKKILAVGIAAVMLTPLSLLAETKVSVYSVPFGMVGDVTSNNFRAFEKRLDSVPASSFSLSGDDVVMSGDGITIILDNKEQKIENFNRILAALYSYAKNTPGIDANAVKQAIGVLAVKKSDNE